MVGLQCFPEPRGCLLLLFPVVGGDQYSRGFVMVVAIIMNPYQDILRRRFTQLCKDRFNDEWRREDLLEAVLERGAQGEADKSPKSHVLGRSVETFDMGRFYCGLANALDI